ncbi:MAG: AI-2E family transporter [Candidatus Obscuribacterales bacterium]|nr:AI-2E family transporter [Candidatus Obscuribacterales bacterium]
MFKWIAVVLILLFVYHVREVFPPFIVGGILAYLLFPLVNIVNKLNRYPLLRWMSPKWAILFIYCGVAVSLGWLIFRFGPVLGSEVHNLVDQRHEIVTNLVTQIATGFKMNLDVERTSETLLQAIESSVGKPEELVHIGGLLSHGLLSLLICVVSSIYLIVDSKRVGRFFLRFVPDHNRVTMINIVGQLNKMLSKYVVGQLILIIIMSVVAFVFLSIFKIKYALVIAIMSGILEIIPVLGPFLAIAIAVIVSVSQFGIGIAPWIIGCYWIARQLEDYYVVPAVIGHAVELHPLGIIFAVIVGETMAGALGMLIAIPVAASLKVVIDTYYPPEESMLHQHVEEPNVMARVLKFIFQSHKSPTANEPMEINLAEGCGEGPAAEAAAKSTPEAEYQEKVKDWAKHKNASEGNIVQIDAQAEAEKIEQAELKTKAEESLERLEKQERKTKKMKTDTAEKHTNNGGEDKN